jgi:E1A/CREB-binding protein
MYKLFPLLLCLQSKAKVGMNQALEHSGNESACSLCNVATIYFEPPPVYCSPCGARIKRNASYYTALATETCHNFCLLCYNEARSQTIQVEDKQFPKEKLVRKRNDDKLDEPVSIYISRLVRREFSYVLFFLHTDLF